jgi:apolipoprotein N-acyltransferase
MPTSTGTFQQQGSRSRMSSDTNSRPPWYRSTLAIALLGSAALWAAMPPLGLGWLAWIAPIPWLLLIRVENLPGRRPYRSLWLAGFAFWLMTIHWIRLPHPALHLGWLALSAYLACYLPVFVGLSRVAVHQVGVPLWLASPIVWTGLELGRAHLLTGFLMASLSHTQVHQTALIQISDMVGEYGVGFVIMAVAACIVCIVFRPRQMAAIVPAALILIVALGYGYWRLGNIHLMELDADSHPPSPRIALIQGNSLAEWKADPSRKRQIMNEYLALSDRAVTMAAKRGDGRPLDLIVWPETMFRSGLFMFDDGYQLPASAPNTKEELEAVGRQDLASLVRRLDTPVLVGVERWHLVAASPGADQPPPRRYNAAVLVDRGGNIVGAYDKVHRVMFGEYIPFADRLPFLYDLTPLTGGIVAGAEPKALKLDDVALAPNICYETAVPHVLRRQVATLEGRNESPDVLVNITNDAWYWGSSELDQHLACGVFRAVETRRPLVIAANGGISAWIDQFGRIRAQSPRQQGHVIIADVELHPMESPYVRFGDWFAGTCLTLCIVLAIIGWKSSRGSYKRGRQGDKETGR